MSRSYAVRTEDGRLFRRNRRHLRQSKEQFVAKDVDVEIPSPATKCPQPEVYTEPSAHQHRTAQETQHLCAVTKQAKDHQSSGPLHHQLCQKNSAVTRSGRSVHPPSYLKDYVQIFFWKVFLYVFTLVTVQFFKEGKV